MWNGIIEQKDGMLYYACHPSIEIFGLELAVRNRDIEMLEYLWD
jgi:hypothetical protein